MTWYWVVLILILGYGLGITGLLAWREFRKPYRRAFQRIPDRRRVQRRRLRQSFQLPDRRQGDRRLGERRRLRPAWPTTVVVVSAVVLSLVAVTSYAVTPVPSFFEGQPQLVGSGWADCDTPITWSVDTSRLTSTESAIAVRQMRKDFSRWGAASGLEFRYVGYLPVGYNDATYQIIPSAHPSDRHIFVTFLRNDESSLLDERTVGLAMPSKLVVAERTIVEGSVVLSIEYVKKAAKAKRSALYLHEIGHALGLGHGLSQRDAMYYIVSTTNELSPGDIAGIEALIRACLPAP